MNKRFFDGSGDSMDKIEKLRGICRLYRKPILRGKKYCFGYLKNLSPVTRNNVG